MHVLLFKFGCYPFRTFTKLQSCSFLTLILSAATSFKSGRLSVGELPL